MGTLQSPGQSGYAQQRVDRIPPVCASGGSCVFPPPKKKMRFMLVLSKLGYEKLPDRSLSVGRENIRVKEKTFSYEIKVVVI